MQREGKSQSDHYFFPADFYLKADISCYTPSKCIFCKKKEMQQKSHKKLSISFDRRQQWSKIHTLKLNPIQSNGRNQPLALYPI